MIYDENGNPYALFEDENGRLNMSKDDFCNICHFIIDYELCNIRCCSLCYRLTCKKCLQICEDEANIPENYYIVCKSQDCIYVHEFLNKLFCKDIACHIASFRPTDIYYIKK